jgi:hypothetical protein
MNNIFIRDFCYLLIPSKRETSRFDDTKLVLHNSHRQPMKICLYKSIYYLSYKNLFKINYVLFI